jgi:transcriptional regulator with XRE-family HTH domain
VEIQAVRSNAFDLEDLNSLGDHIRARRLSLGHLKRDVAARMHVNPSTIANWEKGRTEPPVAFWPRIMTFLGYCPYQQARSFGERLWLHRTHQGLSVRQLAKLLGVDSGSLSRWETGERRPCRHSRKAISAWIADSRR